MRLGLFSDAHGNTAAFVKAFDALTAAGADALWYLGDLVGYVPDPSIVAAAMARPVRCLSGNHEAMMLAHGAPGPREAVYFHQRTRAALSTAELEFLRALRPRAEIASDGRAILLLHGSPLDPVNGYVYPDTDLSPFADCGAEVIIMGHTHRPMDRRNGGKRFINVGSCGLPRDGTGLGSACLYDTRNDQLDFLTLDIREDCRHLMDTYDLSEAVLKHYRAIAGAMHRANRV